MAVVLCLVLPMPAHAQNESYDTLVGQATELLKDHPDQAFSKALAATQLDANRYEGYLWAGVASYRQDQLDTAEKFLKLALDRAPEDKKSFCKDTLKTVSQKRDFLARVAAGDKAVEDGSKAKAAEEYTAAWKLFPNRADVGLKAAQLWNDIHDLTECARVLYPVAASEDAEIKKQAKELLDRLKPSFRSKYEQLLTRAKDSAWSKNRGTAETDLADAEGLCPDQFAAPYYRGLLLAADGKADDACKELRKAIKAGDLSLTRLFSPIYFDVVKADVLKSLAASPQFETLVRESFGSNAATDIPMLAQNLRQPGMNAKDRFGDTPLYHAIYDRKLADVKSLIAKGADPNLVFGTGSLQSTPLLEAIHSVQPDIARALVEGGADVNLTGGYLGQITSPLYFAVEQVSDNSDLLIFLLEHGADVNFKNEYYKKTVLEVMAFVISPVYKDSKLTEHRKEILASLSKANIKPAVLNAALLTSVINHDPDMAAFLLERGADAKSTTKGGNTVLMELVDRWQNQDAFFSDSLKETYKRLLQVLIDKGFDINAKNAAGNTALMGAATVPSVDGVELLLDLGADPKIKNNDKHDALYYAKDFGSQPNSVNHDTYVKIIEILQKAHKK
jgi:ankyrin repeat protein